jgi:hypothetical protein
MTLRARDSGRSARGRRRRAETPRKRSDAAARFTSTRRARQRAGAADDYGRLSQSPKDRAGICTKRFGDVEKFNDIKPSLTAFIFGDERLWLPNPERKFDLCEAGRSSKCYQMFQ